MTSSDSRSAVPNPFPSWQKRWLRPAAAQHVSVSSCPTSRVWLAAILVTCIAVRVTHLISVYPTPQFAFHRTWGNTDMYLLDQWAQRIVGGDILGRQLYHPVLDWMLRAAPAEKWTQWFGDAPTYLKAPFYAYLLALLRWLFGDAMLPVTILQILASTLCALLLFAITTHVFDETSGLFAAFLFAVYAPAIHYDVVMLRGPWITLASLIVTWLLIRVHSEPTRRRSFLLGLSIGFALLVNEGFLLVPPLVLALLTSWIRLRRQLALLGGTFVLGLALALSPVVVRNLIVGVPPLQLAVTGGPMVAMFNAGDADPVFVRAPAASFLPLMESSGGKLTSLVRPCLQSFASWHEIVLFYLRRTVALVVPFENPDNSNFYYAALKDPLLGALPTYAVLFPLGAVGFLMARSQWNKIQPLLPVSLSMLVSIMATAPASRYRLALVVFLFPFAGLALAHAIRRTRDRRWWAVGAAAGSAALLFGIASLLQRQVIFRGEEPDFHKYRAVEFQVAAGDYVQQQRFREASQELLQLAKFNPSRAIQSDALIRAAQLQVQAADRTGARQSVQALAALDPNDPRTLILVGDLYWRTLADPGSALAAYRKAKELRPAAGLDAALRARLVQLEGTQGR